MKRSIGVSVSLALLICVGCGQGGGGGGGGAKSPEDAFKGWSEAAGKADFKAFASHMTKDSQSAMAGYFMTELTNDLRVNQINNDRVQAVEGLLKRHGLSQEAIEKKEVPLGEAPDNKATAKEFVAMGEMAKDRTAFLDDTLRTFQKLAPLEKNPLEALGTATLKDLKVDGDTATGKATATVNGHEKTDAAHFRKEDGVWKIDLMPEVEAKGWEAFRQ
jgi:hypothetical protein